jgi:hypothetical protein
MAEADPIAHIVPLTVATSPQLGAMRALRGQPSFLIAKTSLLSAQPKSAPAQQQRYSAPLRGRRSGAGQLQFPHQQSIPRSLT